jgi:hypothetical protein
VEAQVLRVVHLGFEVREELVLAYGGAGVRAGAADGDDTLVAADAHGAGAGVAAGAHAVEPVVAQITRAEAQALELHPGDIVWVRTQAGTTAVRAA